MAGGRDFDRGKFKELVLHLSQASAEDEGFGMVKLNKLLFRADFEAFRLLGRSITGEEYEKQEYGPVARDLPIVLDELARTGYIIWQHYDAGPYKRDVPEAVEVADMGAFSDEERDVIARTLTELRVFGARGVSEWAHEQSVGWRVKRTGERIPYTSAVVSRRQLAPRALAALQARFS